MLFYVISYTLLQSLNDDLTYAHADLDDMNDKAQALARTSGDTRVVSQASQLTSRYQARSLSIKVQYYMLT